MRHADPLGPAVGTVELRVVDEPKRGAHIVHFGLGDQVAAGTDRAAAMDLCEQGTPCPANEPAEPSEQPSRALDELVGLALEPNGGAPARRPARLLD